MESVSSSSHHQPIADRIGRALRHRLLLLHRSESTFFVLGATGNVYTVTLSATPSCTCPDRTTPCKHILFIFIRVLGVSPDDVCLRRRTLRPCQLRRMLVTPTSPESLAGANVRKRFHELFFAFGGKQHEHEHEHEQEKEKVRCVVGEEDCPICLEKMVDGEKVVWCTTCRNPIHEECLWRWKKSKGRRAASCVICRARWRDVRTAAAQSRNHDKYLNLAAYLTQDDFIQCQVLY